MNTEKQSSQDHIWWQVPVLSFALILVAALTFYVDVSMKSQEVQVGENAEDSSVILPENEQNPDLKPVLINAPTEIPAESPTPTQSISIAVSNNNFSTGYDYKPVSQRKGTVRIPILTFHHIATLPKVNSMKPYYVTPQTFERMLQYLKEKNYRTVTSQQFYDLLMKGKNPTQKTVMLTFDDGPRDNYKYAFPLLKKYGFVGVFYVNTKHLAITAKQLKEMSDAGMVIDSHTASHLDLRKVKSTSQLISEIASSKIVIESITKKKVVSVSYPGCVFNDQVVAIARNAGYKFGVSCGSSIDHKATTRFALSRMHVYNDFTNFKKRLSGYWIMP